MEQGPVEQIIIKQCMSERLPLPGRIQNAPQLRLGLELYYGAFLDLDSGRPLGYGEGPISWMSVYDYCMRLGLTEDQHDDMQFFIRKMDIAYLAFRKKQMENKSGHKK